MYNCKADVTPIVISDIFRPKPTNRYPLHYIGTISKPVLTKTRNDLKRPEMTYNKQELT